MDSSANTSSMASGSVNVKKSPLTQINTNGGDKYSATFQLDGEDHTLGNALRFAICRNPLVKFCGYSLPHPNEKQVLMQIQVYPDRGTTAKAALEKGLIDLKEATNSLKSKFHNEIGSIMDST